MSERIALPPILADEIGLAYLRHGTLVARTAFELLQPMRAQRATPQFLRASTAWFLNGREIRQAALGATGFSCGDRAFELACALAHMRNLFLEDPDTQLFLPLPTMEEGFPESFLKALDSESEAGEIEPDRIVFELVVDAGPAAIGKMADALQARGFALCIGNFGAAGSSSALLETVAPDFVRFDAQWVRLAGGIDPSRRLLSSLVSLLRDDGKTTILAGITTPDERSTALAVGVDLIGGLLLAPPYIAGTASPHRPRREVPEPPAAAPDNVIPIVAKGRSHQGH